MQSPSLILACSNKVGTGVHGFLGSIKCVYTYVLHGTVHTRLVYYSGSWSLMN